MILSVTESDNQLPSQLQSTESLRHLSKHYLKPGRSCYNLSSLEIEGSLLQEHGWPQLDVYLAFVGSRKDEHADCKWFTDRIFAALYHKDVDLEPLQLDQSGLFRYTIPELWRWFHQIVFVVLR